MLPLNVFSPLPSEGEVFEGAPWNSDASGYVECVCSSSLSFLSFDKRPTGPKIVRTVFEDVGSRGSIHVSNLRALNLFNENVATRPTVHFTSRHNGDPSVPHFSLLAGAP